MGASRHHRRHRTASLSLDSPLRGWQWAHSTYVHDPAVFYRGYDFKYLFDLSSYYNQDRDAYYEALRSADQTGNYTRWLEYFMGGFSMQMYVIRDKVRQAAEGFVEAPPPDHIPGQ